MLEAQAGAKWAAVVAASGVQAPMAPVAATAATAAMAAAVAVQEALAAMAVLAAQCSGSTTEKITMKHYALILAGSVVNIIVVDDATDSGQDYLTAMRSENFVVEALDEHLATGVNVGAASAEIDPPAWLTA